VNREFVGSVLRILVSLALFEVAWPSAARAAGRIVYVDAATGNDANDCLAQTRACKTIQRGAAVVRGSDQMIIGPGTYYEFPVFQNLASSATSPVWIKAQIPGTARISGMWKEAALGQVTWRDDGGGVYSAAHGAGLFGSFQGTYVFRFQSMTDLLNASAATTAGAVKTPPYGFVYSGGRISLKLPGGVNPNGKSVLISPPSWGEAGNANVVSVLGSPYVIIDGLVIEGSGTYCLNFSQDSIYPTVRNTRFEYCREGMLLPNNGLVEWSEYTYPGYYDFAEQVRVLNGSLRVFDLVKSYGPDPYFEGEFADTYNATASRNCEFRYNFLHEAFDGEGLGEFEYSESHHNVYLRNYDDHIEMEGNEGTPARELRLHDNLFLSAGLISFQEASLAGPQYVYRNVYYWYDNHSSQNWTVLKTKAPNATGGIYFYHNLFWGNSTELFWQEESRQHLHFRNNILVFSNNRNSATSTTLDADYNLLVNDTNKSFLYGSHGAYLGTSNTSLKFLNVAGLDFGILAGSSAENRGVALPGFNDGAPGGPDVGPFETGFDPGGNWPRPRVTTYTTAPPERWNGGTPPPDTTPPGNVPNLRRGDTIP
jgi:hypothetical protein